MPGGGAGEVAVQRYEVVEDPFEPCGGITAACGGFGGLCFEDGGSSTSRDWLYVGDGRGAYQQVESYTYVGRGSGNFDLDEATMRSAKGYSKWCCLCLLVCALLLAVGVYLLLRFTSYAKKTVVLVQKPAMAPAQALGPKFSCGVSSPINSNEKHAKAAWLAADADKDGWLTSNELVKCEKQHACELAAGEIHALFSADINGDGILDQHEFVAAIQKSASPYRSWSPARRSWCCGHQGVGCTTTQSVTTSVRSVTSTLERTNGLLLPYDCSDDFSHWQDNWSGAKQRWCCKRAGRACPDTTTVPPTPTTTSAPYNCLAGYANWQRGWSLGKKDWCCRQRGRGCHPVFPTVSTTSCPYLCNVGLQRWRREWSEGKKTWCCTHEGKGCAAG